MKKKTATTNMKTSPVKDNAQSTLTVLFMTLIIAIVSGIIFVRGYYLDGTLLLAIGIALLSSLVDLQKISPILKYFVYAMTVIPALLLVILIFRDFT
jgi:hypothetical protein